MRKLILLLAVFLAISCGNDDVNQDVIYTHNGVGNPYTGSVVGMRRTTALAINGQDVNLSCDRTNPVTENYTFEFHDDNTFYLYNNCDPYAEVAGIGTYTTNGNVLTLTLDGMTGKAHMVYAGNDMLEFIFTIGSSGLFHNFKFTVLNV
jgi:hypothetical protein